MGAGAVPAGAAPLARQRATRHTEKVIEASPDSSGPKPAAAERPDPAEAPPKKPLKGR